MGDEMCCEGCGGPIVLSERGQKVIVAVGETGPAWCAECIESWNARLLGDPAATKRN